MKPDLMQQQIDLFPDPAPAPVRHLSHVERMWAITFSDEVRGEVLALISTRGAVWLDWKDFRTIVDKYKIGAWFGHLLSRLSNEGLILRQDRYYGSQHPGDGNYIGFGSRFAKLGTEGPPVIVGVSDGR